MYNYVTLIMYMYIHVPLFQRKIPTRFVDFNWFYRKVKANFGAAAD